MSVLMKKSRDAERKSRHTQLAKTGFAGVGLGPLLERVEGLALRLRNLNGIADLRHFLSRGGLI